MRLPAAPRLSALVIGAGLLAGCASPVVTLAPATSNPTAYETATPPLPAPPSAAPSSGGLVQVIPSSTPTPRPDRPALQWSHPVTISATALPFDILVWHGAYVAVGTDGDKLAAWTSPDFATWTPGSVDGLPLADAGIGEPVEGPGGELIALGVHGRLHCEVGEGATCDPQPVAIWTSADGRSWHGRRAPAVFAGATIASVAAGPGGIVAVGDTGWDHPAAWFSADGRSWSRERLPAALFRHAEFWGLTAYRGRWVLTGLTDPEQVMCCTGSYHARLKAAAWYSADGRSWSRARVESAAQETIGYPFAGSAGLAAGGFNWTWLSADGRSWRPGPRGSDVGPVASDGGRIIGESQGEGDDELDLWASTDGRSWQALADAGDVRSKPSWNGSVNASVNDYVLVSTGLVMIGCNTEDSGCLLWLARPTGAP